MAKKKYYTPVWFNQEPGDDVISFGGSQGTSGDEPVYEWDPRISAADISNFWSQGYDETDLQGMDTNDPKLYISLEEFEDWYDSEGRPWD